MQSRMPGLVLLVPARERRAGPTWTRAPHPCDVAAWPGDRLSWATFGPDGTMTSDVVKKGTRKPSQ